MCGILAAIPLRPEGLPAGSMSGAPAALRAIRHRGPDATGLHLDSRMRFALGHVRLSVQDVSSAADQPLWSDCGRYAVVFNGEIYNFVELRSELESLGCHFRTRSDTEVLLHALIRWGLDAVARFNGMWAFAFVDAGTGEVTISRDRWGVKPLYFADWQGVRGFCSEAKGLLALMGRVPAPDSGAVGLFLRFGIGGESERSWFSGIRRFPVGMTTRFRPDGSEAETRACWEYPTARDIVDRQEAVVRLRGALSDSIRIRLRSDVPFGLSLSGGVDSSIIAWLASAEHGCRLDAFTAWHPPKECSELPRAELVAARFGHRLSPIMQDDDAETLENLRTCIYHLDAAHASPAIVPYLNLCRAARQCLTVMLEGQGADELLAGYQQFGLFAAIDAIHDVRLGRAVTSLAASCRDGGPWAAFQDFLRFTSRDLYIKQADRWGARRLLGESLRDADPGPLRRISVLSGDNLNEALLFWHRWNLTNLLQYGDAIAMSVNLETRCPFLDWRVVELGFRLSPDLLLNGGLGKHVLRTMGDGAVPDQVLWRRRKDGFPNPTIRVVCEEVRRAGWPREGLRCALDCGLLTPRISEPGSIAWLSPNAVFRIYSLLLWVEEFQCGKPLR